MISSPTEFAFKLSSLNTFRSPLSISERIKICFGLCIHPANMAASFLVMQSELIPMDLASHAAAFGYWANGAKAALSLPSFAKSFQSGSNVSFAANCSDFQGSSMKQVYQNSFQICWAAQILLHGSRNS